MVPFQYLAFDPGGATGWAHFINNDKQQIFSGTFWKEEHHVEIFNLIEDAIQHNGTFPLTVITESFEFRQNPESAKKRRGLELVSREYIGVMKLICQEYQIPLVQQMPAHAMSRMTDERLELVGHLRKPLHECRHENDALRHLFFKLIFKDKIDYWKDMLK